MVAVRFIILVFGGQKQIALENAALRQQLAAFKRSVKRPSCSDEIAFTLRMIWKDRKSALVHQLESFNLWLNLLPS
jgi:hypothetical protein